MAELESTPVTTAPALAVETFVPEQVQQRLHYKLQNRVTSHSSERPLVGTENRHCSTCAGAAMCQTLAMAETRLHGPLHLRWPISDRRRCLSRSHDGQNKMTSVNQGSASCAHVNGRRTPAHACPWRSMPGTG